MRLTVEAPGAGKRLDRYLATHVPNVSRAAVMKYLKEGQARLNGRPARPGFEVKAGDEIDLPGFEERIREIRKGVAEGLPEVPRLRQKLEGILILYEDLQMVVVDFTASWCITCKVNESVVLESERVLSEFDRLGVAKFKADWTLYDDDIRQMLASFGKAGVPMYLVYRPGEPNEPKLLPELLTVDLVLEAIRNAASGVGV